MCYQWRILYRSGVNGMYPTRTDDLVSYELQVGKRKRQTPLFYSCLNFTLSRGLTESLGITREKNYVYCAHVCERGCIRSKFGKAHRQIRVISWLKKLWWTRRLQLYIGDCWLWERPYVIKCCSVVHSMHKKILVNVEYVWQKRP